MLKHMMMCAVIVGATSTASAHQVEQLDGFLMTGSPGPISVNRPMNIIHDQLSGFPESVDEGNPRLEVKSYLDRGDRLVVDVVESGLLDDSIRATHRVYKFINGDDGKFQLWGYGYRQQCARSDDIDAWVTGPCP